MLDFMLNLVQPILAISPFAKLTMVVAMAVFGLAVLYVFRPTEHKLVLMRPMSLAAIFATISGLLAEWMAVLEGIAATPDMHLTREGLGDVYRGVGTSFTLGFVCFGLLAAAWLLIAVGQLRRAATISA